MLLVVQAVVDTETAPGVPDMAAVTPTDALAPVAIESLFPAVPRTRFPLVAVIAPKVAVIVVPAVIEVVADKEVPAVIEPVVVIELGVNAAPDPPKTCQLAVTPDPEEDFDERIETTLPLTD